MYLKRKDYLWVLYLIVNRKKRYPVQVNMSEMDRAKREATVDVLTEDDAKQALKEILHTMHRWTDGPQEHQW